MQHFALNLNKHLAPLWDQRIPLLLHYLVKDFLIFFSWSSIKLWIFRKLIHSKMKELQMFLIRPNGKTGFWNCWKYEFILSLNKTAVTIYTFLKDTLEEVDLDEWTSSIATTLSSQLSLYPQVSDEDCTTLEKLFLMKCLGTVLRSVRHGHPGQLVQNNLSRLNLLNLILFDLSKLI